MVQSILVTVSNPGYTSQVAECSTLKSSWKLQKDGTFLPRTKKIKNISGHVSKAFIPLSHFPHMNLSDLCYCFPCYGEQERAAWATPSSWPSRSWPGTTGASSAPSARRPWSERDSYRRERKTLDADKNASVLNCWPFFQDASDIICPECARKKMLAQMEAEAAAADDWGAGADQGRERRGIRNRSLRNETIPYGESCNAALGRENCKMTKESSQGRGRGMEWANVNKSRMRNKASGRASRK